MSIVQAVNKNLTSGGTTQTTGAIATTPGNDLIFCAVYNAGNAGVVTPSDSTTQVWTQVPKSPYTGTASGLTLGIWLAANITGNAANTFTFATTGLDTPTIFVVEFSGRDKTAPMDVTVTASDSTSASGTHTTGTITPKAPGDDLLAFVVATAIAQTFTAGGAWNIPPNGTVTTASGYDAFVQYQNNVALAAVSNTYSVALNDKLDAFIVSLQVPGQPYGDEWHDSFLEVPEVVGFSNSYQQQDVQPQIADVDTDWIDDVGENDAWINTEDQSSPVGAGIAPGVGQYFGDEAEQLDEFLDAAIAPNAYQQADVASQFDEVIDWDEDPDDFFADDFGNDDADGPVSDPWDWTQEDEVVLFQGGYQQFDAIGPTPITVEDAWYPELWGEEPDQIDGTTTDLDKVGPDNNPIISAPNAFEWVFDGITEATDDSWWIALSGDYTLIDVVTVDRITIEDGWDHFDQGPDDELFLVLDTDPTYSNNAQLAEDAFDWFTETDDTPFPEDYQQPPDILPVADAWDWTPDDDESLPLDETVMPVPPQSSEDAWDWTEDQDNSLILGTDPVSFPDQLAFNEAIDWTQDSDDDLWITHSDAVGLDAPPLPDLDWDWNSDDVDDQSGLLNDQLVPNLVVPGSQFTDFAWDFTNDDAIADDWTEWGEIAPVGEDRFGYAIVEALSQTGIQGAQSAFLENAACMVVASYFDSNSLPFVPNAIAYRVDDVQSEVNIVPWTSLPLSAVSQVIISPNENRMISFSRPFEEHQVLFQITDRAGDINYARVVYDVIRVTGG